MSFFQGPRWKANNGLIVRWFDCLAQNHQTCLPAGNLTIKHAMAKARRIRELHLSSYLDYTVHVGKTPVHTLNGQLVSPGTYIRSGNC